MDDNLDTSGASESASASGPARRAVLRGTAGVIAGTVASATANSGSIAGQASANTAADAPAPLLRRKQLRMFEVLDVDGDGAVTPPDTVRLARNLSDLTGNAPSSPRMRQMVTAIEEIWHTLVVNPVDVPDPRRLDAEQFVTVMADRVAKLPDTTLLYIGVLSNLMFAMLDGDNDGVLTKDNFLRLETDIIELSREEAEKTWTAMRTADPRKMTYEECLIRMTDFITSTDPQAAGNRLLGQF